jgi:hypothetical protein
MISTNNAAEGNPNPNHNPNANPNRNPYTYPKGPFATVRAFLHIYPSLKLKTVAALSGAVVNGTHRPAQKVANPSPNPNPEPYPNPNDTTNPQSRETMG